jgi:hypothetical protein
MKPRFDRHIFDSGDEADRLPLPSHAAICDRSAAERAALCMDTIAPGIRFFNVEDVFFLCGVVIEDAAPTIRVGVDTTPPQGSD